MMTRRLALALAATCVAVAAPAAALAQQPGAGEATSFAATFTTKRPDTAAGVLLRTRGKPPVPPATVAPVVRQTVTFPAGTRLRLGALPQCSATDEALAAEGAEAVCPAETRVGSGRAEGVLNGTTVTFDLAVYAVRGRLFFAGQRDGVPLKQGFFGVATGRRLALTVPTSNGAIAPTLFEARIPRSGATWLRTPKRCPRGGRWVAEATFQGMTAVDGAPVGPSHTLRATSPCRRPRGGGGH
jgi:hypothetical protein